MKLQIAHRGLVMTRDSEHGRCRRSVGAVSGCRYLPAMKTEVPGSAAIRFPEWFWGGSLDQFLTAAKLVTVAGPSDPPVRHLQVLERTRKGPPRLVSVVEVDGPAVSVPLYERLMRADQAAFSLMDDRSDRIEAEDEQRELNLRVDAMNSTSGLAGLAVGFNLTQLQTLLAQSQQLGEVVRGSLENIRAIRSDGGSSAFPTTSVHFVQRDEALLSRTKLPSVFLRLLHDEKLRAASLSEIQKASAQGEIIFGASSGLSDGLFLFEVFLEPLIGALSPFIWAFTVPRASGIVVYSLGRPCSGTLSYPGEPLQLLHSVGADVSTTAVNLNDRAASAALRWWVKHLDGLISTVSEPAVFTDEAGIYVPSKHLHALMSVEQLFRRTASIQQAHRDTHARRVLLFTVFDTLERLSSRSQIDMCTLSTARAVLNGLRKRLSQDVAQLLLPAAEKAVGALADVQHGFFLPRQTGRAAVEYIRPDGTIEQLNAEEAAAQYIRVLRNATHGHGSNREEHRPKTDALLAQHDGSLSHDLPLLGYLYLLDLLSRPDALRRNLYNNGKV